MQYLLEPTPPLCKLDWVNRDYSAAAMAYYVPCLTCGGVHMVTVNNDKTNIPAVQRKPRHKPRFAFPAPYPRPRR